MKAYHNLLRDILTNGRNHQDRTGTGRRSVFVRTLRFLMSEGFPIDTTRYINFLMTKQELYWFLRGETNIDTLPYPGKKMWEKHAVTEETVFKFLEDFDPGIKFQSEEAEERYKKQVLEFHLKNSVGSVGPMYGEAWRNAPKPGSFNHEDGVDQISWLIKNLKEFPHSSRHCVSNWIPCYVPYEGYKDQENVLMGKGSLAACHAFLQCMVTGQDEEGKNELSLHVYIRSSDTPIGLPHNIASYATLLHLLARVTDMVPYELIVTLGDAHIYLNQLHLIEEHISREPYPQPKLILSDDIKEPTDLFNLQEDQIWLEGYQHYPRINYPYSF